MALILVTGGADGFGRAVGDWLAANGAGRVVLASRSTVSSTLQSDGPINRDASSRRDQTARLYSDALETIARSGRPLRGIVHAAVVYDDAILADMTPERVCRVLAPKIDGGLNLTRAVEDSGSQLDFFVSFSSLAQVVGWAGQSKLCGCQ